MAQGLFNGVFNKTWTQGPSFFHKKTHNQLKTIQSTKTSEFESQRLTH